MQAYYSIYKPYGVLSQFTTPPGKKSLKDYFEVQKDVYPVGRLDEDSEGLLILTNDVSLNKRLLEPRYAHEREYFVQVEGEITEDVLDKLRNGVSIKIDGKNYQTKPCKAYKCAVNPELPARNPPIRFRKTIPDSWMSLILTEGKNRQVRKMTAAVGFPTLRLVRYRIEKIDLKGMQPGDIRKHDRNEIYRDLFGI
jgi:23S rRNA pseudouridine2457 synthase